METMNKTYTPHCNHNIKTNNNSNKYIYINQPKHNDTILMAKFIIIIIHCRGCCYFLSPCTYIHAYTYIDTHIDTNCHLQCKF